MSTTDNITCKTPYLEDECVMYRNSLAAMIRDHGALSVEECAHLEEAGVVYDTETATVHWVPRAGQPSDLNAERASLVKAVDLFLGPPEALTEEELVEARTTALTFSEMAAELGFSSNGERLEAEE